MRRSILTLCILFLGLWLVGCSDIAPPAVSGATDTVSAEPTVSETVPEKVYLTYDSADNYFVLPVNGATGYASIPLNLRAEASTEATLLMTLASGTATGSGDFSTIQTLSQPPV